MFRRVKYFVVNKLAEKITQSLLLSENRKALVTEILQVEQYLVIECYSNCQLMDVLANLFATKYSTLLNMIKTATCYI